jgi:hypothetical protein
MMCEVASVNAWSVILSHVEWDNVEQYKEASLICRTFYKACRLGAARYFRWDATKFEALLSKMGVMFFRDSVRAVTVSYGGQYTLLRELRPDIKDVKVLIPSSCKNSLSIFGANVGYAGIEHLYFHAHNNVGDFSVHSPLPDGLKSFGMSHDHPFLDKVDSTVLCLPTDLPKSLEKLQIIGCVDNGGFNAGDIPILPDNLRVFEYIGIHADDRFFEHGVPLGIEEIKIVAGDYDCLYLIRYLSVRLEKLRKLTLIGINGHINNLDVDLTRYPSLEYLMFNDEKPENINTTKILSVECCEVPFPDDNFHGYQDARVTIIKFDPEGNPESRTKRIKR